jgi:flavin-dependent dehydrogenase
MSSPIDALVVGLGPAGAAAAIRLARLGVRVTAVDRARFPRDKVCSEYLSPETLRHLHEIDVLGRVEHLGAPLHGARVIGPRGSELVGRFRDATVRPFRPTGLSIPRRTLDHALVERAREAGVTVLEETTLVGLDRAGSHPLVTLRRGGSIETATARVVLGADGLGSVTARLAGGRTRGWLRRFGFVAHVADVRDVGATAEMHVGEGGYLGLNAIGGGLTNVAVVVSDRWAREARGDPEGFWWRALERFPGVRGRVDRGRIVRRVIPVGPFAAWSRSVVSDGVLLLGDAADFFDPFTGEGIGAALRGAELAAPVVAAALAGHESVPAAALRAYLTARRAAFRGKWAVERMIGYGMLVPRLFDRAVGRLARRGLADTLVGVTGAFVPAREVLRPAFLAAMVV